MLEQPAPQVGHGHLACPLGEKVLRAIDEQGENKPAKVQKRKKS